MPVSWSPTTYELWLHAIQWHASGSVNESSATDSDSFLAGVTALFSKSRSWSANCSSLSPRSAVSPELPREAMPSKRMRASLSSASLSPYSGSCSVRRNWLHPLQSMRP
eukprot:4097250-Prymnesium_polylepis.1